MECIEQVQSAKLLGVIFQSTFSFVDHVDYILEKCSQRIFFLKHLRDQGLPLRNLHTVYCFSSHCTESFAVNLGSLIEC